MSLFQKYHHSEDIEVRDSHIFMVNTANSHNVESAQVFLSTVQKLHIYLC